MKVGDWVKLSVHKNSYFYNKVCIINRVFTPSLNLRIAYLYEDGIQTMVCAPSELTLVEPTEEDIAQWAVTRMKM